MHGGNARRKCRACHRSAGIGRETAARVRRTMICILSAGAEGMTRESTNPFATIQATRPENPPVLVPFSPHPLLIPRRWVAAEAFPQPKRRMLPCCQSHAGPATILSQGIEELN